MSTQTFDLSAVLRRTRVPDNQATVKTDVPKRGFVRVSDLTRGLQLANTGVDDSANLKLQNYPNTNFPRNTPCYICGPKGCGKTYLLAGVLQYVTDRNYATRVFYVYSENVDTTITRAVERTMLYNVPKALCVTVLAKYLSKKTKFMCCDRFLQSWEHLGLNACEDDFITDIANNTSVYWDNMLNEYVKLKHLDRATEFVDYCRRVSEKYTESDTVLMIGQASTSQMFSFNVGRMSRDDYDVIVMDDIAQFGDIWGQTRMHAAGLYKYFTITRQNQTTFYLAGQAPKQLPKMLREQLGAVVLLKGVDLDDLDASSGYRITKAQRTELKNKFATMMMHDGALINYNTGEIEYFKA